MKHLGALIVLLGCALWLIFAGEIELGACALIGALVLATKDPPNGGPTQTNPLAS